MTANNLYNGMLYRIRPSPMAIMTPTPMETNTTIANFEIIPEETIATCPAKMCKSGSATEIKNPKIKPDMSTIHNLFDFAREDPMLLPIGVIPISTPNKKMDKPIMISVAPSRNLINIVLSKGAIVKLRINTRIVIGKTANKTSFTFSNKTFK